MNQYHNKQGQFAPKKIAIHPIWVFVAIALLVLIVTWSKANNVTVPETVEQPETVEVVDRDVEAVKDSPEFKARVENLAKQEALLRRKQSVIDSTTEKVDSLKKQIASLEATRDADIATIESELSVLRDEFLRFQSAPVLSE